VKARPLLFPLGAVGYRPTNQKQLSFGINVAGVPNTVILSSDITVTLLKKSFIDSLAFHTHDGGDKPNHNRHFFCVGAMAEMLHQLHVPK
jgi:hypothetical protein